MAQHFRAETPSQEIASTGPGGGGQAEQHEATVLPMLDDLINGGRMELAPEYIASNMVNHDTSNPVQGLEGLVQFFSTFRAGFPDMRNTIEDIITEGDKVVMRITVHATHTGTFMEFRPPAERPRSRGSTSCALKMARVWSTGPNSIGSRLCSGWV